MKKILLFTFISTILILFFGSAKAADGVFECHNCSSYQYKQKAFTIIPPNAYYGNYDVYVVDVPNGVLKRYLVGLESDPAFPGGTFKFAVEQSPESYYLNSFNDLYNSYNTLKGLTTAEKTFEYPTGSAYDLRGGGNGAFERAISSYIWDTSGYYFAIQMYTASALNILGKVTNIRWNVYVKFPDGTEVQMMVTGIGENGEVVFEYAPDTAVDADNNNIPDNQTAFNTHAGTYTTDDSINEFLRYAASMGIPISGSSSGSGTYVVECSHSQGKTTCVLKKIR